MDNSFFDLYVNRNFFDADICRNLIAEMRRSSGEPALTYGKGDGAVNERVRRVSRVSPSEQTILQVIRELDKERERIGNHFGVELVSCEEPQFLRYNIGDFFVAHQDGNTGLVNLETDRTRRVSISIFLNNQSEPPAPDGYGGGSLVFSDWRTGTHQEVRGEAGMLVAFRSELTHEVTPIIAGERHTVVSWYVVSDE